MRANEQGRKGERRRYVKTEKGEELGMEKDEERWRWKRRRRKEKEDR